MRCDSLTIAKIIHACSWIVTDASICFTISHSSHAILFDFFTVRPKRFIMPKLCVKENDQYSLSLSCDPWIKLCIRELLNINQGFP